MGDFLATPQNNPFTESTKQMRGYIFSKYITAAKRSIINIRKRFTFATILRMSKSKISITLLHNFFKYETCFYEINRFFVFSGAVFNDN